MRDGSGESGAWGAEYRCSVTASPFIRPVSPIFVIFDVSIKTRATTKNKPTPQYRSEPYRHNDLCAPVGSAPPFTHDPAPDSLCLSPHPLLPLTHTYKSEDPIVAGGHTPKIRVKKPPAVDASDETLT